MAFCWVFPRAFAGDGERIVSLRAHLWFRNGGRRFYRPLMRVSVNRKFTPSETIQILRKFSRFKTLKIYRRVV